MKRDKKLFFNLITISLNMLSSVNRQPYSVFCNLFHGTQKSGRANAVSFISSTAPQLCGRAKDNVPTCSTGNTAFSPWPKLPGETRCREVVVVWGILIDRVLVAHAWIWLLKKKLSAQIPQTCLYFFVIVHQFTDKTNVSNSFRLQSYLNPERFRGGPRRRQVF